jgi:hypothetical protein
MTWFAAAIDDKGRPQMLGDSLDRGLHGDGLMAVLDWSSPSSLFVVKPVASLSEQPQAGIDGITVIQNALVP